MLTDKIQGLITSIGQDCKTIKDKFNDNRLNVPHLKKALGIYQFNMDGNLIENGNFYNGTHNFTPSLKLERRDTNNNFAAVEYSLHSGQLFHYNYIPMRDFGDVYLLKFDIKNGSPEYRTKFHPYIESYLYSNWTLSTEFITRVKFKLKRPFRKGEREIHIHDSYISSVNSVINSARSTNASIYLGQIPLVVNGYQYREESGLQNRSFTNGIRAQAVQWNPNTGVLSNLLQSGHFKGDISTDEFIGISYYNREKPIPSSLIYTPENWTTVTTRFRLSDHSISEAKSFRVMIRLNVYPIHKPKGTLKTLIANIRLYNLGKRGRLN